jgi:hypothetical protein
MKWCVRHDASWRRINKDLATMNHASEKSKWESWCRRSGFTTLPLELLQEQPVVVLLLERALVSWSLAIDERGGHEDLCGLDRRSVIPYIYRRTELYCSSLPCLSHLFFLTHVKWCLPEPFIAQGWAVTLRPGARQVALRWLKPYTTSRIIMARSSKWCLVWHQQREAVLSYHSVALNMVRTMVSSCRVVSPL